MQEKTIDPEAENLAYCLPAMDRLCRVSVLIPAFLEEDNVEDCLGGYARQLSFDGKSFLDPQLWEILVLVNREEGIQPDATFERVMKMKELYPNIRIHVGDVVFSAGEGGVGRARKILADVAQLRAAKAGIDFRKFFIQGTDMDLKRVDATLIVRLMQRMERDVNLVAVAGERVFDPGLVGEIDILFLVTRAKTLLKRILLDSRYLGNGLDSSCNFTFLNGPNVGMRLSSYAQTTGYNPRLRCDEDSDISRKMCRLDGGIERIQSVVVRSARRMVLPFLSGDFGSEYSGFGDISVEREVRDISTNDVLAKLGAFRNLDDSNIHVLEFYLNILFEKCFRSAPGDKTLMHFFKKMLGDLGFCHGDYVLDIHEFKIKILSLKNIRSALRDYRHGQFYEKWLASQRMAMENAY